MWDLLAAFAPERYASFWGCWNRPLVVNSFSLTSCHSNVAAVFGEFFQLDIAASAASIFALSALKSSRRIRSDASHWFSW
jgi:hypothetical protein